MAKKRKPGALYFTDVAVMEENWVVLTGCYYDPEDSDDLRTAVATFKRGVWGGLDLSGISHAVRRFKKGVKMTDCLILERNRGLYHFVAPDTVNFVKIASNREGFLMDLQKIGKHWYAVGGHQQIYKETGGVWKSIDKGVYVPGKKGEAKLLLSIHGFSDSDIYTVGFDGIIFHYNGKAWKQLKSPTNVGLQRVLCVAKDEVYICGNANALYRGNSQGWTSLTKPDEDITFWDMAFFKGKIYICTQKKLFTVENDSLKEVKIPVKGPLGFYRMDADDDELWTCGNECLLQFDGKNWKQHIWPDNG